MSLRSAVRKGLSRLPIDRMLPGRRVLLHGFYGAGNVGDEAILEASRQLFAEHTGLEPIVLAWNSRAVEEATDLRAMPWQRVLTLRGAIDLASADAYLVGGGGVLKDFGRDGRSTLIPNWLAPLEAAQTAGVPTATWFVGVENIDRQDSRDALRRTLSACRIVSVRDNDSAEILREIGVEAPLVVGPDPVVILGTERRRVRVLSDRPVIGVCLREWHGRAPEVEQPEVFERALREIARALDRLVVDRGARVVFIPFRSARGDDDVAVAYRVHSQMARKDDARVLQDALTWLEAFNYLDRCDVILAMRLHALIAATSMGIPVIALEYMPKVSAFMKDLGLEAYDVPMSQVDADGVGQRLESVLASHAETSRQLAEGATARDAGVHEVARSVVHHLGLA